MTTERRLDQIEQKIDKMADQLSVIAVQHEQLRAHDRRIGNLEKAVDTAEKFQASCPRQHIRWVWATLIPLCFTIGTIGFAVLRSVKP